MKSERSKRNLTVRLTEDELGRLKEESKRSNRSMGNILRLMVLRHLREVWDSSGTYRGEDIINGISDKSF